MGLRSGRAAKWVSTFQADCGAALIWIWLEICLMTVFSSLNLSTLQELRYAGVA